MPFVSRAQRKALWAKNPKVAREFEEATPKGKKLPEYKHKENEMKQVKREKKEGMLVKGKAAAKPKNMEYNKKVMEKAGYSPSRASGTAYGEVGMEKMARRHESEGMKKAMRKKEEKSSRGKYAGTKRCGEK